MRLMFLVMMKVILKIILTFFTVTLISCGYSFYGSSSILPPEIEYIYVADSKNSTTESRLSQVFNRELKDRFSRYTSHKLAKNINQADAILYSEIFEVIRDTRSVTAETNISREQEIGLIIKAKLVDKSKGSNIWSNNNISISKIYGTESSSVVTSSSDFASGGLSVDDLAQLNSIEVARGEESKVFEELLEDAAKKIHAQAILPDF